MASIPSQTSVSAPRKPQAVYICWIMCILPALHVIHGRGEQAEEAVSFVVNESKLEFKDGHWQLMIFSCPVRMEEGIGERL